jgi:hypothetical protein
VNGTFHVGNSLSNAIGFNRGPQYGKKELSVFHYGKYKWVSCGGTIQSYEVDALQWTVGSSDGADVTSVDNQCGTTYLQFARRFAANSTWDRSAQEFKTWSDGVTVFGATLSTQSGSSQWVAYHYDFGNNTNNHWMCGNDDHPSGAHRVLAGK